MSSLNFLTPEFWNWVNHHLHEDPSRLRLASHKETGIDIPEAIIQIECRARFGKKLAKTLEDFPEFYFPGTLAGEQSTSDALARFHAGLIKKEDICVDMTAGLGIDAMHLAKICQSLTAIERNEKLCDALIYNAQGLKIRNIEVRYGDSTELLSELKGTVIFIDPARRDSDGRRVYGLQDCEPNVISIQETFRNNFKRCIIKASPMLDVTQTINDLQPYVSDIYAIGTTTECKELVVCLDYTNDPKEETTIHAVTISASGKINEFSFLRSQETNATIKVLKALPKEGDLLYIPYPATMKAAPVKLLSEKFDLYKFHANTHLYFSNENAEALTFPGEILKIVDVIPWQSKNLKRLKTRYPNLSISVRNFGMTAEALRIKLGVKEGGKDRLRLFGIGLGKDHTDKVLIVAQPK